MSRKGANSTYWGGIGEGLKSIRLGMKITWRHFLLALAGKKRKPLGAADANYFEQQNGIATLQYPHESMPVPDNGRYRLHNEIDDCIVCDKCAKICPVNCIEIESIKATEEIRKTSDGSSVRLHAAKFDIDMAKCCYCGLCTTVCPTECLTMTKTYDFSEFDVADMTYNFSEMTPDEVKEKEEAYAKAQEAKQATKKAASAPSGEKKPAAFKPKMPGVKPKVSGDAKPKPVFKPKMPLKKKDDAASASDENTEGATDEKPEAKPVFKPKMPIKKKTENPSEASGDAEEPKKKKPIIKPIIKKPPKKDE